MVTGARQVQFPKILICSDSIHSATKMKLNKMFPNVSYEDIQRLYGLNVKPMATAIWEYKNNLPAMFQLARSLSEQDYLHLNDIDLDAFLHETRSKYWILHCQFQSIDCRLE